MKNPILYDGFTMEPKKTLHPLSLKLTIKSAPEGFSSATMVLMPDEAGIGVGKWVGIVPPNDDDLTVYYVRSESTDEITGLQTLELEHCFGLLEGMVAFGEFDAEAMGGEDDKVDITTAIRFMLSKQPSNHTYWQMRTSDCDFSDEQGWKVSNEDLSSAITGFTDAILDCQFEFDMSSLPWKLKLKEYPTTPTIEMRRARNIESLTIKRDSSKMYTRAYPTGKNGIDIKDVNSDVAYLDRNTSTYGIIAEVITDSTIKDKTLLKAWATKQLKRNSTPYTSISVSAMDLSNDTGTSWDRFKVGKLCRIPLPESGEVIEERIVELNWADCVNDETAVTVTMGQQEKTIADVMNENSKSGGAGSKKANNDKDNQFGEDGEKIEEFENSDIWLNKDSIWSVCGCYTVTTDSSGKHLKVNDGTALEIVRSGATLGVYDSGNLTAGIIVNKINGGTATIAASHIQLTGSTVSIDADWTNLINGTTLCAKLSTSVLEVNGHSASTAPYQFGTPYYAGDNLYIPYDEFGGSVGLVTVDMSRFALVAGDTFTGNVYVGSGITLYQSTGQISCSKIQLGSSTYEEGTNAGAIASEVYVSGALSGTPTSSASGGTITLTFPTLGGGSETVNFNIADTQYYIDGVAAARTAGWSAAYGKVDLPDTGSLATSVSWKVPASSESGGTSGQYTYDYTLGTYVVGARTYIALSDSSNNTVGGYDITSLISEGYDEGWSDAALAVTWPGASTETTSITIGYPLSDGTTSSRIYGMYLTHSQTRQDNYVLLKYGSTTVAKQFVRNTYDDGWGAAEDSIVFPTSVVSGSEGSFTITLPSSSVGGTATKIVSLANISDPDDDTRIRVQAKVGGNVVAYTRPRLGFESDGDSSTAYIYTGSSSAPTKWATIDISDVYDDGESAGYTSGWRTAAGKLGYSGSGTTDVYIKGPNYSSTGSQENVFYCTIINGVIKVYTL